MRIGVFFQDSSGANGPAKVAKNLFLGLKKLGIEYLENKAGELNGCLQSWTPQVMGLPLDTVMGPNIAEVPATRPLWARYHRFVANSQWTYEMYGQWPETKGKMVGIWPVGIDTSRFNDSKRQATRDCLVYVKNVQKRFPGDLERVLGELSSRNLTYSILQYGSYVEEELIRATKTHRFCFLLTDTESQGIAYMEILSSGIACYSLGVPAVSAEYTRAYGLEKIWASATPYFDKSCGISDNDRNMPRLDEFIERLSEFRPREYVLRKHTLEMAAERYVGILCGKKESSYELDRDEMEVLHGA
jgi:hypothetical protein